MNIPRSSLRLVFVVCPLLLTAAVGCKPKNSNATDAQDGAPKLETGLEIPRVDADNALEMGPPEIPTRLDAGTATAHFIVEAQELMKDSLAWRERRLLFYENWGELEPEAAINHAKTNNPGASTLCVAHALRGWLTKSPEEAIRWVAEQKENAEKSIWLNHLAEKCDEKNLDSVFQMAIQGFSTPGGKQPFLSVMERKYIGKPENSAGIGEIFETSFTDDTLQNQAIRTFVGHWASVDVEKLSIWLRTVNPEAPWRDHAVAALVEEIRQEDTISAKAWADTIKAPATRRTILELVQPGSTGDKQVP